MLVYEKYNNFKKHSLYICIPLFKYCYIQIQFFNSIYHLLALLSLSMGQHGFCPTGPLLALNAVPVFGHYEQY